MKSDKERKEYLAKYYRENRERLREAQRAYYKANRAAFSKAYKAYAAAHPDRIAATRKKWLENNLEKDRASKRRCYERNRERYLKAGAERQRAIRIARRHSGVSKVKCGHGHPDRRERVAYGRIKRWTGVPPWVDRKELKAFYRNCPNGFHVDHIIPIRHPQVCGLHVIWNLQYLEAWKNSSKANRLDWTC